MGNEQSSKNKSSSKIPTSDLNNILLLTNNKEILTQQDIKDIWNLEIRDNLINFYLKYYFPSNNNTNNIENSNTKSSKHNQIYSINLNIFISLYYNLNNNIIENNLEVLSKIINNYNDLELYIESLIDNIYFIYKNINGGENYQLWKNIKLLKNKNNLLLYKKYLLIKYNENKIISYDNLYNWLIITHEINYFHNYIINYLFKFNKNDNNYNLIPTPCYNPDIKHTLLDLNYIYFLNLNLSWEFQNEWRLLFSSSYNGESFSKLLSCIINQGPCIIIIEDEFNNIFGGFASTNLECSPKFFGNDNSFLFHLKPNFNIYNTSGYNSNYIYLNINQNCLPNGLGFGGQFNYWGLFIDYNFGFGECSKSCSTYKNYNILSNNKNFNIKNIEIWAVDKKPLSSEDKGERSVLDKDTTVAAILELAGKTKHSDGLREPNEDE